MERYPSAVLRTLPFAWVVIFAMDYIGMSGKQIGVLIAVEMLAAILCIIPTSYFGTRRARTFRRRDICDVYTFPDLDAVLRSFVMLLVAFRHSRA